MNLESGKQNFLRAVEDHFDVFCPSDLQEASESMLIELSLSLSLVRREIFLRRMGQDESSV